MGGLVYHLLPEFLEDHIRHFPNDLIDKDIRSKTRLKQYKYLLKGIHTVEKISFEESIRIYQEDPEFFKKHLLQLKSS